MVGQKIAYNTPSISSCSRDVGRPECRLHNERPGDAFLTKRRRPLENSIAGPTITPARRHPNPAGTVLAYAEETPFSALRHNPQPLRRTGCGTAARLRAPWTRTFNSTLAMRQNTRERPICLVAAGFPELARTSTTPAGNCSGRLFVLTGQFGTRSAA